MGIPIPKDRGLYIGTGPGHSHALPGLLLHVEFCIFHHSLYILYLILGVILTYPPNRSYTQLLHMQGKISALNVYMFTGVNRLAGVDVSMRLCMTFPCVTCVMFSELNGGDNLGVILTYPPNRSYTQLLHMQGKISALNVYMFTGVNRLTGVDVSMRLCMTFPCVACVMFSKLNGGDNLGVILTYPPN